MRFIGIISVKDYNKIESELYKKLNEKNYSIININNQTIYNVKNVNFDVILIINGNTILTSNNEILKKIINNSKYLVINADIENDLKILEEIKTNVISYGFNLKNTITASSINDESILVGIQRNIKTIKGNLIEQQDKKVDIHGKYNTNYMLGIIAILIIFEKI